MKFLILEISCDNHVKNNAFTYSFSHLRGGYPGYLELMDMRVCFFNKSVGLSIVLKDGVVFNNLFPTRMGGGLSLYTASSQQHSRLFPTRIGVILSTNRTAYFLKTFPTQVLVGLSKKAELNK